MYYYNKCLPCIIVAKSRNRDEKEGIYIMEIFLLFGIFISGILIFLVSSFIKMGSQIKKPIADMHSEITKLKNEIEELKKNKNKM
jgi:biopolymer transport protein ExbB/TolQ